MSNIKLTSHRRKSKSSKRTSKKPSKTSVNRKRAKTPKKTTSMFGRGKRGRESIETKVLGKLTTGYTSTSIKITKEAELTKFINEEITNGPQIVSIPVPPYRHAFLVDIQPTKIMISDWGGEENKTLGIVGSKYYQPGWEQYSDLMIKLEEKYKRPIEYYPVDEELYKIAVSHNERNGGGGCSYYIYAWVQKYYPNYSS
jgi:hypothetical protein